MSESNVGHVLPCGCMVEYPRGNNTAAKQRVKVAHEGACKAFAKIRAKLRADQSRATTEKHPVSRGAYARGDDERYCVDAYWGDGTYDSEWTTDAMIDAATEANGN